MIQKEEAVVSEMIVRDLVGEPPRKKTKKTYVYLQQRLKKCCDYAKGRKDLDQLLSGLSPNIRFWFKVFAFNINIILFFIY